MLEREPGRVRVGLPAFVVASATERERDASVGSFFPALSFPKLINCKQAKDVISGFVRFTIEPITDVSLQRRVASSFERI